MFRNPRPKSHRDMHPSSELLEERALLNAAIPHRGHGLAAPAEILAAKNNNPGYPGSIVATLPLFPSTKATTVPANGDVNPYGVAVVPAGFPRGGVLRPGQILVSNFNDSQNVQGTGTTIVAITPGQNASPAPVFFTSKSPGLTEALGVLKSGFVIVGNVPTTDGTFGTIGAGSIQIINRFGQVVQTLSDSETNTNLLDGPWAATVNDKGRTAQLFVSDVEDGTVARINLKVFKRHGQAQIGVVSGAQIASGYTVAANATAVVLGPGGLAYNAKNDTLYVAATGNNAIFAIPHASRTHSDHGTGELIYQDPAHLRGPIGLALAPDGDLITTNDDAINGDPNNPSDLVEFTTSGQFVSQFSLDPAQGAAFGLVIENLGQSSILATVNDDTNTLDLRFVEVEIDSRVQTSTSTMATANDDTHTRHFRTVTM